ncbi:hypothetical protein H5410_052156 [Solanum commersonii]|uniref:Uncharacterized protein n=1 Tax=Solanum commersonii TaxID=4109 RepID=A0A9J5X025_SOLCO|nr:hypothetical protein H5410_052156 [Solanum commersonii]
MTKADAAVSSIPPTIVTSDNFYNDGIPSNPLLDVRVETTTPNNSDVPYEGKVSDVTQSRKHKREKFDLNCDAVTPSEG